MREARGGADEEKRTETRYEWEGMSSTHDFFVVIHGKRGAEWEQVAGTRRFPVQSPFPVWAQLPGYAVPQRIFLLALDQIEAEMRTRIVAQLARKFGISQTELEQEIVKEGIPILEEACDVIVHHPQRWF